MNLDLCIEIECNSVENYVLRLFKILQCIVECSRDQKDALEKKLRKHLSQNRPIELSRG